MNQRDNAIQIIEKTISKTNDGSLTWMPLDRNRHLFRKPDELDYTYVGGECTTILYDKSYYCSFKDGYIFVLSYTDNLTVRVSPQPYITLDHAPESLALYVETENAPVAKSFADSNHSSEESIQLRRLYNLVVDKASDIEGFVEDFLNS